MTSRHSRLFEVVPTRFHIDDDMNQDARQEAVLPPTKAALRLGHLSSLSDVDTFGLAMGLRRTFLFWRMLQFSQRVGDD